MKKLWFLLRLIISILLIGFLINKIGINKIIQTFISMNKIYLILIIPLYVLALFLGGLNLYFLTKKIKNKIKLKKIINYYLISWALSSFMLGKLGEFSIIYLLKKEKINYGKGLAIVIIDKAITIVTISIAAIITILILLDIKEAYKLLLFILLLMVSLFLVQTKLIRNIIKRIISKKFADKFKRFNKTLTIFLKKNKKLLLLNFILTLLKWAIMSIVVYIIFLSFGSRANIILISLISMSLTILLLIPITINGIGIKETVAVYLYGLIGLSPEIVISTYLLLTVITYACSLIILAKRKLIY